MKKSYIPVNLAAEAMMSKPAEGFTFVTAPEPTNWTRKFLYVGAVLSAAFLFGMAMPAHSQGAMASDVRVIKVRPSPSIVRLGSEISDAKERAAARRETQRQNNRMELEAFRAENRRALEADRAYYKKLADQRKARAKKK